MRRTLRPPKGADQATKQSVKIALAISAWTELPLGTVHGTCTDRTSPCNDIEREIQTMISDRPATLIEAMWPESANTVVRNATLMVVGSLLLTLSAKVHVPFWPVPMTMQTFAVMVLGAAFGARLGAATVLLYLVEGGLGLPVFSGTPERGLGLAYMAGPTGGYLFGFLVAAALTGWLAERGWDRSIPKLALAMSAGHVLIFVFGFAWLAYLIGAEKAWTFGVAPFYAATIFKTALAAVALPAAWTLLKRV